MLLEQNVGIQKYGKSKMLTMQNANNVKYW
jgi:hypothetical protein